MQAKINKLLEMIDEIVDDGSMPYRDKVEMINAALEGSERLSINFEEFISWFELTEE